MCSVHRLCVYMWKYAGLFIKKKCSTRLCLCGCGKVSGWHEDLNESVLWNALPFISFNTPRLQGAVVTLLLSKQYLCVVRQMISLILAMCRWFY
jgi:hypothetical protein